MKPSTALQSQKIRTEDALVNGLFTGFIAGLAMLAFLILTSGFHSFTPAEIMGMFDPGGSANLLAGAAAHLAVSAVYGLMFGGLCKLTLQSRFTLPIWLGGIIFGLLLFALAEILFIPRNESPLLELPIGLFAAAHLVYGLVIGFIFQHSFRLPGKNAP